MTGGRPVCFAASTLRTQSCHLMPNILRWHFMWKLSRIRASSARTVHVSVAYRRMERTSSLYVRILMVSDKRRSRNIFDNDALTAVSRTIPLFVSGRHWPSEGWTLPKYTKLSTHSTRLPSTVMSASDCVPAPTFCTFVFDQEIRRRLHWKRTGK